MLSKQTSLNDLYALSPAQENILHYMLQTADNTAYLEQLTFNIVGELDAQLMHASWQTLTNHYDILRTIFVHKGLQPLQMALEHVDVEFRFTDIQRLTPQEQQEYLHTFKQQDRAQGFNLYQDILSRVTLFQLDTRHFAMVWTYHAILLDSHCSHLLQQSLIETYQSLKENKNPQLPAITPYHHYTEWLSQQTDQDSHQYWQHYLHDYQTIMSVPKDNQANQEATQAAQYTTQLAPTISQQLFQLAEQKAIPVNTILQTVWGYLLCYYNDCQDVVFGTTTALNSEQFNTQSVVGLLNNIIPIRIKTHQKDNFEQLLQKTHQDLQTHQAHQYHSFADIQQHLQFPIVDHVLCFEPTSYISENDGIQISVTESFKHSGFELVVSMTPTSELTQIQFSYHTDVYSHEQVQRTAQHFEQVLSSIVNQCNIDLSAINPLTQLEIQQLVHNANPSHQTENLAYSLNDLFLEQVQQQGDKAAIIHADKTLTYSELNQKANQVAHYLIQQGVKADDCIAVCVDSSIQLSIALWGVLKAGAAYVLQNTYDETQQALQQCKITLTTSNIETILSSTHETHEPKITTKASDLAYLSCQGDNVVMVEQSNLQHFCTHLTTSFHWHHSDVVYTTETHTDMAALSLIGGLILGVTVVLPSQQALANSLQQHQASILQTTPQALQALITEHGLTPLHDLSVIMLNGECLTPALHAQLQRLDNLLVFNLEDSPETTLASYVQCLQSEAEVSEFMLAGETAYIVSKQNHLLPVGAIGEICIGGAGVCRGYLDNDVLTQHTFIQPNFLNQQPHSRLYKTGYLGKRLHNGSIEPLGKI
ncbi:condensation domain-containing protein [Candidatus Albibeggiatoa sp. nov. NOAA]|uniref:condensation domain-containing protein n=1 Tax=Candidatus Albibeggiatoa sp. nov. NOAA TaxID=3162724 RepID=UPI0032F58057|nr:condensation domain-containing protein [Thiotrichaceae bacterium]